MSDNNGRGFKNGLTSITTLGGSVPVMGVFLVAITTATWFLASEISSTKETLRQEMHAIGAKTDLNAWRIKVLEEWRERKRSR